MEPWRCFFLLSISELYLDVSFGMFCFRWSVATCTCIFTLYLKIDNLFLISMAVSAAIWEKKEKVPIWAAKNVSTLPIFSSNLCLCVSPIVHFPCKQSCIWEKLSSWSFDSGKTNWKCQMEIAPKCSVVSMDFRPISYGSPFISMHWK